MNKTNIGICLIIVLMSACIYFQSYQFGYINYDDQDYVTENRIIQKGLSLHGIAWAFSFEENDLTYWHPLAYIAHMVDCQVFGVKAGWHHLSNAFLHTLNAILLYFTLLYMTGSRFRSAFAALLLAVHPVCVDSVAWISQKKTLLAACFWLLSVLSYTWYVKRPDMKRYLAVCTCAAAGLMTKPVLVTLPMALLVLDFWPLKRVKIAGRQEAAGERQIQYPSIFRLVLEKIPLMVLVVLWGITPFLADHVTAKNISLDAVPLGLRFENAVVSYVHYIGNFFYPVDLAFLYPYPDSVSNWAVFLSFTGLAAIFAAACVSRHDKPYLLAGWLVFFLTLVPFLGFVQGAVWPAYADRFAYVPYIGLYLTAAWGFAEIIKRPLFRYAAAGAVIIILAILAFHQAGVWKDNIRLYTHALKVTKNNYLAHNNLGIAYDEQGLNDEALRQYEAALAIKPGFSKAHHNMAVNMLERKELEKAEYHFKRSILSNPDNPVAKYNLGNMAMAGGRAEEALVLYQGAIADKKDFSDAYNNLGVLWLQKGRAKDAFDQFRLALKYGPDNVRALTNMGNLLFDMGRLNDADMCFTRGLSLEPRNIEIMNDLGVLYATQGKTGQAVSRFETVLELAPGNVTAKSNLALIRQEKEKRDNRLTTAKKDYEDHPGDLEKQRVYAALCVTAGDFKTAEKLYLDALDKKPGSTQLIESLADMYGRANQFSKAILFYQRLADAQPDRKADAFYTIAGLYGLQNKAQEAVQWLQAAADSGYRGWASLSGDPRFDSIRNTELFQEFTALASGQR